MIVENELETIVVIILLFVDEDDDSDDDDNDCDDNDNDNDNDDDDDKVVSIVVDISLLFVETIVASVVSIDCLVVVEETVVDDDVVHRLELSQLHEGAWHVSKQF